MTHEERLILLEHDCEALRKALTMALTALELENRLTNFDLKDLAKRLSALEEPTEVEKRQEAAKMYKLPSPDTSCTNTNNEVQAELPTSRKKGWFRWGSKTR